MFKDIKESMNMMMKEEGRFEKDVNRFFKNEKIIYNVKNII